MAAIEAEQYNKNIIADKTIYSFAVYLGGVQFDWYAAGLEVHRDGSTLCDNDPDSHNCGVEGGLLSLAVQEHQETRLS